MQDAVSQTIQEFSSALADTDACCPSGVRSGAKPREDAPKHRRDSGCAGHHRARLLHPETRRQRITPAKSAHIRCTPCRVTRRVSPSCREKLALRLLRAALSAAGGRCRRTTRPVHRRDDHRAGSHAKQPPRFPRNWRFPRTGPSAACPRGPDFSAPGRPTPDPREPIPSPQSGTAAPQDWS